ncbi:MAG TPA: MBL fold metallo-hydrolase [Clostridiaceae bacterium]|nr:MBL fold metallo-hydrolase [Clostridiaceae bacterium]
MLKFCSLFSGSSGNSIFIGTDKTKILIDAGLSGKKITEALLSIGEDPASLDAILVSHEHDDHVRSLGILSKRYNIPVYANEKTWEALIENIKNIKDMDAKNIKYFEVNKEFEIGGLGIKAFPVPHDANEPVGFCFFYCERKITVATDIGHVTPQIKECIEGSDLLLLESNHDIRMLQVGTYPWWLKKRILGERGHLSNEAAAEVVAEMAEKGTQHFLLGHLSKNNNFPHLAYQTTYNALTSRNILPDKDVTLEVALRDCISNVFCF